MQSISNVKGYSLWQMVIQRSKRIHGTLSHLSGFFFACLCCSTLHFVSAFSIMITFNSLITLLFSIILTLPYKMGNCCSLMKKPSKFFFSFQSRRKGLIKCFSLIYSIQYISFTKDCVLAWSQSMDAIYTYTFLFKEWTCLHLKTMVIINQYFSMVDNEIAKIPKSNQFRNKKGIADQINKWTNTGPWTY
jgi:hypothetical protein